MAQVAIQHEPMATPARAKLQDNPLCELCLRQNRIVPAVAIDHIVSIKAGGHPFPGLDSLMSLCTCVSQRKSRSLNNKAKTSR